MLSLFVSFFLVLQNPGIGSPTSIRAHPPFSVGVTFSRFRAGENGGIFPRDLFGGENRGNFPRNLIKG